MQLRGLHASIVTCRLLAYWDGVPEMTPVVELRLNPLMREPLVTEKVKTSPVTDGVRVADSALDRTNDCWGYEKAVMRLYTANVIVVLRVLIAFCARIVTTIPVSETVGVPEISPVALFRERPEGREPLSTENDSTCVFTDGLAEKLCHLSMA